MDNPHDWADSMAEWAVANPSPRPRIPRLPPSPGIVDEPPFNTKPQPAPAPKRSYAWHAVVVVCVACAYFLIH